MLTCNLQLYIYFKRAENSAFMNNKVFLSIKKNKI